ncbi:Receptor-transporting protein 3 [Apodemus speciosus]|uniref:Receptor-transporting protein 3 n=1 Tax=Apodemus speciosus TaxID=105296 RepID=A0ABQ0F649_APOSI
MSAWAQKILPQPGPSTAAMIEDDTGQWQHMFQELIQEVKPWHKWTLRQDKDLLLDVLKPGWTQYQQKAFARFHCSSCSRSWASGRVLIVFHMRWFEKKAKGQVKMRVFAQRCNQCPEAPFATPEFTWDNVSRILNNLLFRILKKCYKEGFKQMGEIPLLGDTSLEGPHDSSNCEACLLGFCAQNDLGQASKPPAPPLSPTSMMSTGEPKVTATGSNSSSSPSSSKVEKPQASKVNPQASNPTKDDPKVSCTPKPSTTPKLTIQQPSVVSSPPPSCVIQMPSPVHSSRAADVAKNTRSKTPMALLSPSLYAPPTPSDAPPTFSNAPPTSSYGVHVSSSWRPPANTSCEVERSSHIHPQSQSSCCKAWCGACCEIFGHCCEIFGHCCEIFGHCCEIFGHCCEIFGRCCVGCCEIFWHCSVGCCNCMSENPQYCLIFLVLLLLLWYLL